MSKPYEPYIPPARRMRSVGPNEWFATAQLRHLGAGRADHRIRLPGEWHGRTQHEAEAKARRAAEEWIAQRS